MNIPYGTAYHALVHRARAEAGECVLVHGASGGVGIAAVQLARARGLTVIGTAGTERGRRLVLEQGAHHVLDHGAPGALEELMREMLANAILQKDLEIVPLRGRIVVIGSGGPIEINPRLLMNRDAALLGMALFPATPAQLVGIHAALSEGLRNGTLRPVVGQELPLAQAPRADVDVGLCPLRPSSRSGRGFMGVLSAHEGVMQPGHYRKIVLGP